MSTDSRVCLALMAHADDETLGAGGTLAKLARSGWRVEVALLSDGVVGVRGDEAQDNRGDAVAACERLGLGAPAFLGFTDQRFDSYDMADVANAVGQLGHEPDLIITHLDTDLNRDHRIAVEAAKIVGRPRRKPVSILCAEIPKTTFWNAEGFTPTYYVDITETMDAKLHAFSAYRHEVQPYPHAFSLEMIELLAKYHGAHAGFDRAEGFKVYRAYEGGLP